MKPSEKILFAIGVLCVLMGTPFLIVGLAGGYYEPPKQGVGAAIGLTVLMGVLPVAGGGYLAWRMRQNGKKRQFVDEGRMILQLAKQSGGSLTVAEVELATKLSHDASRMLLEQYVTKGDADLGISESGAKVYHFRDFISDEEKNQAERL